MTSVPDPDEAAPAPSPPDTSDLVSRRDTVHSLGAALRRFAQTLGLAALTGSAVVTSVLAMATSQRASAMTTRAAAKTRTSQTSGRLPRGVRPTRYVLSLTPDLARGAFDGTVVVTIMVARATRELWLNAAELEVARATISQTDGPTHVGQIRLFSDSERCRITLPLDLAPGEWHLRLEFRGRLNDRLRGFYLSTYTDEQGLTQSLAVTQFEAADARRAFPCWDEPDFKAVFALTLVIDPALTALSNTRVVGERLDQGRKVVQFAETIVMSTYLLAFVVGRLEGTAPIYVGKTPIRVWAVPGKSHLTAAGQEVAAFSLRFFEEYYGIPYPGDKLDLIAIPDFSHGAMENLGAVTFRESALLIDAATASHADLAGLADVVSHENAHMWFGDLVTMSWWNGLWLNEAFATFLEVVAVDAWRPQWQRWDQFALARAGAMSPDGLFASRPIEFPVQAVKDLGSMFDAITYQKGAAVLRMLEQFLGPDLFRDGIRRYLRTHAYDNADTHDLWKALGAVSRQPVAEIMQRWVFAPGYPLLSVSLTADRQLSIRQQRFTYLKQPTTPSDKTRPAAARWRVPLQYAVQTTHGTTVRSVLLEQAEIRLPLPAGADTILVNPGGHGYYRVHYAPELRKRLLARFPDRLPPIDRFNLVNDAWATCVAGILPLPEYLELTATFARDRGLQVWSILLSSFERLEAMVPPEELPSFAAWIRARLGPALTDLGWTAQAGESDLTRELRGELVGAMGTLGDDAATQAEAKTRYTTSLRDRQSVDPNLLPALVDIAAWTGGESDYQDFFSRFRAAATPQEERRYMFGLAGFRSPALVARTLQSTINGDIRTQDGASVISALLTTRHGHEQAWEFVKEHWATLEQRFPPNGLRRMFGHLASRGSRARERDVHRFIKRHHIDLGGKTLAQHLEHLRIAVVFQERHAAELSIYLRAFDVSR